MASMAWCVAAGVLALVAPDTVVWRSPRAHVALHAVRYAAPGARVLAETVVHHACPRYAWYGAAESRLASWPMLLEYGLCDEAALPASVCARRSGRGLSLVAAGALPLGADVVAVVGETAACAARLVAGDACGDAPRNASSGTVEATVTAARFIGLAAHAAASACLFHARFGLPLRASELALSRADCADALAEPPIERLAAATAADMSADEIAHAAARRRFARDWRAHAADASACLAAARATRSLCDGAPPAERPPAPVLPAVVAVGLHGHYDRLGRGVRVNEATTGPQRKCSDWFGAPRGTFASRVLAPLAAAGVAARVYAHTYASGCAAKDAALVASLRPALRRHAFSSTLHGRVSESYLRVLKLMLDGEREGGGYVLLRFDTVLHRPLTQLGLDWARTSLAFRDKLWAWRKERKASDLFFAGPMEHARALARAINVSSAPAQGRERAGALHWLYAPLCAQLGESALRMVDARRHGSSSVNLGSAAARSVFISIDRSCAGRDLDDAVRAAGGGAEACWRGLGARPAQPRAAPAGLARGESGGGAASGDVHALSERGSGGRDRGAAIGKRSGHFDPVVARLGKRMRRAEPAGNRT